MSETIVLPRFNDMHCHFRYHPMLSAVLRHTAEYCAHAIVMPNVRNEEIPNGVVSASGVVLYRNAIQSILDSYSYKLDFTPLMTIEIRDSTTPEDIYEAHKVGAVAGKVYPLGVTTNSDMGLRDFSNIPHTLRAMEEVGMLLLLHGESPEENVLVTEREKKFLPTLDMLSHNFGDLKIVLEHITTKNAVDMVLQLPENVAATITGHHLYLTLNDVIGNGIRPHNFCMPVAKRFEDRDALVGAAISGNPKFFLGSDTAPHLQENKECGCGCAGIFTAPVLPSILVELFDEFGTRDKLEGFTSQFGGDFYGLPKKEGMITLVKEDILVIDSFDGIVPFMAGKTLKWRLVAI